MILNLKDLVKFYSGSCLRFLQDPVQIFFWVENTGSYQDFIRVSSGAGSNLLIMILSGMIVISDQDLGKKMTRSLTRIVQEQEFRPLKKIKV